MCRSGRLPNGTATPKDKQVTVRIDEATLEMNSNRQFEKDLRQIVFTEEDSIRQSRIRKTRSLNSTQEFIHRIATLPQPVLFSSSFQYRPDPILESVSELGNIVNGTIEFRGKHLASVYYPQLEMLFSSKYNRHNRSKQLLIDCEHSLNNSALVKCRVPPVLPDEIQPPTGDPISASYKLKMDALTLDSNDLPRSFRRDRDSVYLYRTPKFAAHCLATSKVTPDDQVKLRLAGENLAKELNYRIRINGKQIDCLDLKIEKKILKCKLNITGEQAQQLASKSSNNISVHVGDNLLW